MTEERRERVHFNVDGNQAVSAAKELEHSLGGVDRAVNEADRDIKDFGRDAIRAATEAAAAARLLKAEMDGAGAKVKSMGSGVREIDVLSRAIRDATTNVRLLGNEFDRTGRTDVFDKMRSGQRELKSLEKMKA